MRNRKFRCGKSMMAGVLAAALSMAGVLSVPVMADELPEDYPLAENIEDAPVYGDIQDFASTTLDGEIFDQDSLKDYDLTVIDFWADWCGPCVRNMPNLAELYKKMPENVQIVTYCADGSQEKIMQIMDEAGYEGITIIRSEGDLADVVSQLLGYPTTIFFDSEGRQVGTAMLGAPEDDYESTYIEEINTILEAMGKDTIGAEAETESDTEVQTEAEK